jgi:hypothetical protein
VVIAAVPSRRERRGRYQIRSPPSGKSSLVELEDWGIGPEVEEKEEDIRSDRRGR